MWSSFKVGPFRFRRSNGRWSWTFRAGKAISFGGRIGKK